MVNTLSSLSPMFLTLVRMCYFSSLFVVSWCASLFSRPFTAHIHNCRSIHLTYSSLLDYGPASVAFHGLVSKWCTPSDHADKWLIYTLDLGSTYDVPTRMSKFERETPLVLTLWDADCHGIRLKGLIRGASLSVCSGKSVHNSWRGWASKWSTTSGSLHKIHLAADTDGEED